MAYRTAWHMADMKSMTFSPFKSWDSVINGGIFSLTRLRFREVELFASGHTAKGFRPRCKLACAVLP